MPTTTTTEPAQSDPTSETYLPLILGGPGDIAAEQISAAARVAGPVVTLQTKYVYDPLQQLVQVIDPEGNVTTHEYDLLGRRTATTTPDGGRVELEYDLASQVTANAPGIFTSSAIAS